MTSLAVQSARGARSVCTQSRHGKLGLCERGVSTSQAIREVALLDAGLNCRGAYLTDAEAARGLGRWCRQRPFQVSLHGTPRQWGARPCQPGRCARADPTPGACGYLCRPHGRMGWLCSLCLLHLPACTALRSQGASAGPSKQTHACAPSVSSQGRGRRQPSHELEFRCG